MRLTDRIELITETGSVEAELRAQVGTTGLAEITTATGQYVLEEKLRAIIPPDDRATPGRRWRWRGDDYTQYEAPKVRRKNGRDHHYTITLERYVASA